MFLILLFGTISLYSICQTVPVKGVLDLREYNFRKEGIIKLNGEWKFFWEQLIDPIQYNDSEAALIPVPSAWTNLEDYVPTIKTKGFASYSLKILVPKNIENLAFRFTEVFSASAYYINGKNIGFNGFPGTNRFQTVFGYNPTIHVFPVRDTVINLVIHVSNFEHRSGGLRGSVELGTPMQIMAARADRQFRDFFLIGAFLIIGIYFMGLYLMRSELYKLFFSLICLLMVFRTLLLSESDILRGDWVTGISRLRLEYLSFDLLVPLFVLMIRYVFPNDFPKILFKIIILISLLMIAIVIFSPVSLFSSLFTYFMFFVIFTAGVIFYVIILGWIRGRTFAPAFAIGIAVVVAGAVNDMLFISDVINTGLISHFTMFIYLIIYAMIFSGKTLKEFQLSLRLSDEIISINQNLENIVLARTKELNEKSQELTNRREELKRSNEILHREVKFRDRLFTIIGHDIKGPIGYSNQVLEMILGGSLSESEEEELLKLMANSSRTTLTLVENLLTWGRSQSGELKSMAVKSQINKIIIETAKVFDLSINEKKLKLSIDIEEGTSIFADKEHLKLIIRNLLGNAIKFSNIGGEIKIEGFTNKTRGLTTIKITDNGIGIPSSDLKKLFSDFEVTSSLGTMNEQGTGIGLRLCKELVDLNHGSIEAESKEGVGSVFKIHFPSNAII